MNVQEVFVGCVSIVLGMLAIFGAVSNQDWYYQLDKLRWIEANWGRIAARSFYVMVGMMLIILGVAIAVGFGPYKKSHWGRSARALNFPRPEPWFTSPAVVGAFLS